MGADVAVKVTVENFVVAETARMFDQILFLAGGVNQWLHFRAPTPPENQPVIRMNRDTLYSASVVDTMGGATLTIPDTGDRYLSVMVIDPEHYLAHVFTEPGTHALPVPARGDGHLFVTVRTFVDPTDPADIAAVNAIQDQFQLDTSSARPFEHPAYDQASLIETREALLVLSKGIADLERTFGQPDEVDPIRHLVGSAATWGGLPTTEATYIVDTEPRPIGHYTFTMRDVPVDAFWSITVYNRDGYLEPNPFDTYSVNSVTAVPDADGTVTVHLVPDPTGAPNQLAAVDGWNYALRLYRPHPSVLDRTWTPPTPDVVS